MRQALEAIGANLKASRDKPAEDAGLEQKCVAKTEIESLDNLVKTELIKI